MSQRSLMQRCLLLLSGVSMIFCFNLQSPRNIFKTLSLIVNMILNNESNGVLIMKKTVSKILLEKKTCEN